MQGTQIQKDAALIVRSPKPLDLETPVHLLDSWITPNELFFVRGHLYIPQVDIAAWRLSVDGAVEHPLSLTLEDLKRFDPLTAVVTMECAGNGRALFQPRVAGAQWVRGAVGTARWTGVRMADVLRKAGARQSGFHVAMDGADQPMGSVPDFVRSVPVEKCLHPATILAYEMNGQPLPVQHGFPVRAIVPGWEGAACVKWLTRMTVQDHEADGFFMKTAYRYPTRSLAPGEAVDASEMKPVTSLEVKSIISAPRDGTRFTPGAAVEVRGAAWAGENEVVRVEVSTDLGRTWQPAELTAEKAPYAWRRFRYQWKAPGRGAYAVMARASDSAGRVQPVVAQWNPSGYLNNAVYPVWIRVDDGAAAAAPAPEASAAGLPAGAGRDVAESACLACHDGTLIGQQRMDRGRWKAEVEKMIRWGAPVPAEQKDALTDYLFSQFH